MKQVTSFSKGVLSAAALIFLFALSIMGCQKEVKNNPDKFQKTDAKSLAKDESFITLIRNFNIMVDYSIHNFSKDKRNSIRSKIDLAKGQKLSAEQQYSTIINDLTPLDKATLENISKIIYENNSNLQKRYGTNLTRDIFIEAATLMNENTSNSTTVRNSQVVRSNEEGGCGWRYYRCSVGVAVEGALILAGCEALSAGTASVLCLIGASNWAAEGIEECANKYCPKTKN